MPRKPHPKNQLTPEEIEAIEETLGCELNLENMKAVADKNRLLLEFLDELKRNIARDQEQSEEFRKIINAAMRSPDLFKRATERLSELEQKAHRGNGIP